MPKKRPPKNISKKMIVHHASRLMVMPPQYHAFNRELRPSYSWSAYNNYIAGRTDMYGRAK